MKVRVVLANGQEIMRAGLRSILERTADMELVAEVGDGRIAVSKAQELRPDLAMLHTRLPELNGIEATRQIRESCPTTHVVLLAELADRHLADQALQAGASAYLLTDSSATELKLAIDAANTGGIYISPRAAGSVLGGALKGAAADHGGAYASLTPREREVLQLVAEGRSTQEIAARLSLSARTVDAHRRQLTRKLGVHGVAELTKYAIREGLTTF
jgi:DNA-binding NarL/FixJ family response regulator